MKKEIIVMISELLYSKELVNQNIPGTAELKE